MVSAWTLAVSSVTLILVTGGAGFRAAGGLAVDPPVVYCNPRAHQFCPGQIPCPECGTTSCKCPSLAPDLNISCINTTCSYLCDPCCKPYLSDKKSCDLCIKEECGAPCECL